MLDRQTIINSTVDGMREEIIALIQQIIQSPSLANDEH